MPDKRYTKVEEEIIQILDRLESEEPAPSRPHLRVVPSRPRRPRRIQIRRPRLDTRPAWFWLALSFGLAAGAYFARDIASTLALLLAIGSICAFFAPLFSRRHGGAPLAGPTTTKMWRGKDISFGPPPRAGAGDRARRWIGNRRSGPR
ncbi:MAG TPA: hypothetical protein VMM78_06385 [Thermomicrobiales bacterium]|nr:hypothetical protein [Thermomicrobiales bacterium]